jgi:hypothetical protein
MPIREDLELGWRIMEASVAGSFERRMGVVECSA